MRILTELQQKVFDEAKKQLGTPVCLDQMPDDEYIKTDFTASVNQIVDDTNYWNGDY